MGDEEVGTDDGLPAGDFSPWVRQMQEALRGERASDVPCNGCTACCTSSQFVHIAPDETETLSRIPAELLFPAPRLPPGHVLLGYDERGHCPMLVDQHCSIYEHRPRTCRTYDCRIFPAAAVTLDEPDKALIARRAQRWRFTYPTETDRMEHQSIRAAATFLREHTGQVSDIEIPTDPTRLAVLAVEMHDVFLEHDEDTGAVRVSDPDPDTVRRAVARLT
jgi:hypothetical protein